VARTSSGSAGAAAPSAAAAADRGERGGEVIGDTASEVLSGVACSTVGTTDVTA
jgi:hypothetical protein